MRPDTEIRPLFLSPPGSEATGRIALARRGRARKGEKPPFTVAISLRRVLILPSLFCHNGIGGFLPRSKDRGAAPPGQEAIREAQIRPHKSAPSRGIFATWRRRV